MKVILTGASGNLGSHICKSADFDILRIDRTNWNNLKDISESEYDVFVHCAYDLKTKFHDIPAHYLNSNIQTTAQSLEICSEKKIKRYIYLSSASVYGDSNDAKEESDCNPVSISGHVKLFNEKIVTELCKQYNIEYLILRVFNTYAGQDTFSVVSKLLGAANKQCSFVLVNNGTSLRDFIHIQDIANIVCHYIKNKSQYDIVNVGTGKTYPISDLFNLVKNKHPDLTYSEARIESEIKISKANINKLKSEYSCKFIDVLDFLRGEISK